MQDGSTPLHAAAYSGHLEVVQLLLRHRADKKLKDMYGKKELKDNRGEKPVYWARCTPP